LLFPAAPQKAKPRVKHGATNLGLLPMGSLAAILLSGLCPGAANDRNWVENGHPAFSVSPGDFVKNDIEQGVGHSE
jgi:hypothetical protein